MTLKNNRVPLLHYVKLCASFQIHRWSQTWVTLRKRSIRVKKAWPWKLTDGIDKEQGTSSILGQNLWIISLLYLNSNLSYSPETLNSGNNWRFFFVLRDLQIWWMPLKNNRAPHLYYITLCVAFQSFWYIQAGVTVRKRVIRVKIGDFLSRVTLKIDKWHWK